MIMPKLGMYLEDVRLVEWLAEEAAEVHTGDVIFTLETDKVTTDVEADASGILHRIVPADSMVPIGGVIGQIAADRDEYEQITRDDGAPAAEADTPGFAAAQSELFLDYIRSAEEGEAPAEPVTDPEVELDPTPGPRPPYLAACPGPHRRAGPRARGSRRDPGKRAWRTLDRQGREGVPRGRRRP